MINANSLRRLHTEGSDIAVSEIANLSLWNDCRSVYTLDGLFNDSCSVELSENLFLLPEGSNVLDLGCGQGAAVTEFAHMIPRINFVGLNSPNSNYQIADLPNLKHEKQDMLKYLFNNKGKFDYIYGAWSVLYHTRQYAVLQAIARSLRVGGRAVIYPVTQPVFKLSAGRYILAELDELNTVMENQEYASGVRMKFYPTPRAPYSEFLSRMYDEQTYKNLPPFSVTIDRLQNGMSPRIPHIIDIPNSQAYEVLCDTYPMYNRYLEIAGIRKWITVLKAES